MKPPPFLAVFACIVLALLSGCAQLVPLPDGQTVASDRYGSTQIVGDLRVSVRVVDWYGYALDRLAPYVTPIYIEIHNAGEQRFYFDPTEVLALDNEGTLYRPIAPQRLEQLLPTGTGTLPGVSGPSAVQYNSDLAATLRALTVGVVVPHSQIRGAVYFQHLPTWVKTFTVRLPLGSEIREFRFRVQ